MEDEEGDGLRDGDLEEDYINLTGSQSDYTKNMKNFVDYYGMNIQVPANYIFASKAYPLMPSFCLQLVAQANTSREQDMRLRTHYLDG